VGQHGWWRSTDLSVDGSAALEGALQEGVHERHELTRGHRHRHRPLQDSGLHPAPHQQQPRPIESRA